MRSTQRRGDHATVKAAVSKILRGEDYIYELREAAQMHLHNDRHSGEFERTYLRAVRLSMSYGAAYTMTGEMPAGSI